MMTQPNEESGKTNDQEHENKKSDTQLNVEKNIDDLWLEYQAISNIIRRRILRELKNIKK